ncbi:MAG: glutathione S-transferase [Chroococcus sp. CMT-3BRIN-NPC107]|jgi:glutathione S-transferase|nr:glutathione S-transferase [Chroococcus sp. CMT-3BRIN-NPC107]
MLLLQFSTSHYCRKARLALGYKKISYQVSNLTPGLHILKLKPLTGLTTLPVLLPQEAGQVEAVADSTNIFRFLESYCPKPALFLPDRVQQSEANMLEDWLDESIGTATRFVYYHFRARAGRAIDSTIFSQVLIQVVQKQYGITDATAELATRRIEIALAQLSQRWQKSTYLVGEVLGIADLTAAALLSPLALIPAYQQQYPWLFEQIKQIHLVCGEPLPPGIEE